MRLIKAFLIGGACVIVTGTSVQAKVVCPPKPKDPAKAKEIARSFWGVAMSFFTAKLYDEAVDAWKCSYKMFSHPLGLLNIAMAAEKGKKYRIAIDHYWKYIATVKNEQKQRRIMAKIFKLEKQLKASRPKPAVPKARVVPKTTTPASRPAPGPKPVVKGPKPPAPVGPRPAMDRPKPKPRTAPDRPVAVFPSRPATSPPAPKRETKPRIGLMGILGWSFSGLGAALIGTSFALGVMADRSRKTVTDAQEGTNWHDKLKKPYDNYKKYLAGSLACAGIGVASVAAGVVLIVLDRRSGRKKESEKISAVPLILPDGGMLSIEGRF